MPLCGVENRVEAWGGKQAKCSGFSAGEARDKEASELLFLMTPLS